LDFELLTISNSGYPIFLIVQDLIAEARSMGVSVGRGFCGGIGGGVLFENYEYRSIDVQPAFERF
jgi:DNA polymerase-3 subunit alpha